MPDLHDARRLGKQRQDAFPTPTVRCGVPSRPGCAARGGRNLVSHHRARILTSAGAVSTRRSQSINQTHVPCPLVEQVSFYGVQSSTNRGLVPGRGSVGPEELAKQTARGVQLSDLSPLLIVVTPKAFASSGFITLSFTWASTEEW
jgi:hypothetical protein